MAYTFLLIRHYLGNDRAAAVAEDWDAFLDAAGEAMSLQRLEIDVVRLGVLKALADAFRKE